MPIQLNHNFQKNIALVIFVEVVFASKFLLEKFKKYRVFNTDIRFFWRSF
jgi:hypothetical protein